VRRVRQDPGAELRYFTDLTTDQANRCFTSDGPARIDGYRLKVNTDDEEEGVFFVERMTGQATRVPKLFLNKPRQLMFMVPTELTAAAYWLEVRSRPALNLILTSARSPTTPHNLKPIAA
jgi:hypothetical protein